jgi:hypothetical protein
VLKLNYKITTVVLAIVTLISLRLHAAPTKNPAPQVFTAGCTVSVPKSWGQYRGASTQSGFAFEDSAGTIRFITSVPCDGTPVVALEIHRSGTNPSNETPQQ